AEIDGFGKGWAVAEFGVHADAHQREITQLMQPVFGNAGSGLLLVRVLRVEVLDGIAERKPKVGELILRAPFDPIQIIKISKDNAMNCKARGFGVTCR